MFEIKKDFKTHFFGQFCLSNHSYFYYPQGGLIRFGMQPCGWNFLLILSIMPIGSLNIHTALCPIWKSRHITYCSTWSWSHKQDWHMQAYLVYSILMRCEIFGGRDWEQQWVSPKTLFSTFEINGTTYWKTKPSCCIYHSIKKNMHDKTSQVLW